MKLKLFAKAVVVLAVATLSSAALAGPTTITFSDADGSYTNPVYNGPSQYHSQGYTFTAINPEGDYDGAHFHKDFFGAGTVLMHDNTGDYPDIWRLTSSAGAFDLISFTTIGDGLLWSVNGGAYSATVEGLNEVNLTNVTALDFKLANPESCCGNGMDQFVVQAASTNVPEPASIALIGLGLAGLARRRRLLD